MFPQRVLGTLRFEPLRGSQAFEDLALEGLWHENERSPQCWTREPSTNE